LLDPDSVPTRAPYLFHRLFTVTTPGVEELSIIMCAVRFAVLFEEFHQVQTIATCGALEAVGMPFLTYSSDHHPR
jgi:hypothetical protein